MATEADRINEFRTEVTALIRSLDAASRDEPVRQQTYQMVAEVVLELQALGDSIPSLSPAERDGCRVALLPFNALQRLSDDGSASAARLKASQPPDPSSALRGYLRQVLSEVADQLTALGLGR